MKDIIQLDSHTKHIVGNLCVTRITYSNLKFVKTK